MKDWALQCAATGLRVHPLYEVDDDLICRCWAREKCNEKQRGKHPRLSAWQTMASADAGLVAQWWTQWPDAGIGIATGRASRLWVLDLDGEQALDWYRARCREHGVTKTVGVATGRGRHLWWTWPAGDVNIRNSQGLRDGDTKVATIDVRGEGGYVIAPPTMHRSGVRYAMLTDGMYADAPVEAPAWLLEMVKEQPKPPPPKIVNVPSRVQWSAKAADEELARRLRLDPSARQMLAERMGAVVTAEHARKVKCPKCGDRSVWWTLNQTGYAKCSHLNSCGWMAPLTSFLG